MPAAKVADSHNAFKGIIMKFFISLVASLLFFSLPQISMGDVYTWVDKQGVKHFSNEPPPEGVKVLSTTEEVPVNEAKDRAREEKDSQALKELEKEAAEDGAKSTTAENPTPEAAPTDKVVVTQGDDDTFHEDRIRRRVKKDPIVDPNGEKKTERLEGEKGPEGKGPKK